MKDRIFRIGLFCSTLILLLLLAGIIYTLVSQAMPAFRHFGFFWFVTSGVWNREGEGGEEYGALIFISGTFLTALLALIISFPFSMSLALFNGELCRRKKTAFGISSFVDVLSTIPSVILGIFGYYYLRPVLISLHISHHGDGILTAAVVLALMIIPYAASMSTTFISAVPQKLKEGAYSLGATRMEVVRHICVPYAKKGIMVAFCFSMSRAMGEAVAVTMLIGNINRIPSGVTDTGNTMTSIILNQFGPANNLTFSSLFAVALLLFAITFVFNLLSGYIIKRIVS